jgi:hypothetical protein
MEANCSEREEIKNIEYIYKRKAGIKEIKK